MLGVSHLCRSDTSVREVTEHYGETIVRGRYDGTYDKTNLPAELIMTNYYNVVGEKVVSLTVINDRPPEY
jgi:hypothetical protein